MIPNSEYENKSNQEKDKTPYTEKYGVWDLLTDVKFYLALIVVILVILKWCGLIFNH